MVIEGDHDSTFFYPQSQVALQTIHCLVELQARAGGNALIGRQLYPIVEDGVVCYTFFQGRARR